MTTTKKHRGLAPRRGTVRAKGADGYLTPGAAASRFKVSKFTIHRWARDWRPTKANQFGRSFREAPDGPLKLGAYKDGANLWVLAAAVEQRMTERREGARS